MQGLPAIPRPGVFLAAVCGLAAFLLPNQTFAAGLQPASAAEAGSKTTARASASGQQRDATETLIRARVRDGVYTVDGMVAKVHLNYDIHGANYLYLFVPGVGTAVISAVPMRAAIATPVGLHLDELTFVVDDHRFLLTGVSMANEKGPFPAHLYVHLDRSAWHLNRLPMVGYGDRAEMPYQWPGALPSDVADDSQAVPATPASLLPRTVPAQAAAGQVTLAPVSLH